MLELQVIRANPQFIKERLAIKNVAQPQLVDTILELDDRRKALQQQVDSLLNQINTLSKEVGDLFKAGKKQEAETLRQQSATIKEQVSALESEAKQTETLLQETLVQLPNLPNILVPPGKTPEDNEVVATHGKFPDLPMHAKPHWELAVQYNLINFELGTKITGAGFPVYSGKGAKLQRALINFFLNEATAAGYTETMPPHVVNEASAYATGQLPDKEGQMYHVGIDNFYLIPTAEVPLTNLFRDEILKEEDLPVRICGYTPCFRREAGSYGKDVRGLNRLHQFDKVEIVQIQHPDASYNTLDEMVQHVAGLLQKLQLPYRVVRLCGGDMSFASALTYDFEVYSAAQQRWLEVSSVSNFETFQANRLKLRFRDSQTKKNRLLHTLNGSALALPRIVAALLENNQTKNGIAIPEVLQPYTGFATIGEEV
ncbi:serine--tRNA ligase [Sphingobacteriales bacterium UPWRP_1]|nr:serine--tRNA ligase [Sphingobacteriales bacterium TSM_CSM]PSJ73184.1 serine--tRNA ligase [Sphingobacteriales bacterium UPWRP_1]